MREGDHSLITRLKTQKGNIEVRRDFSKEGMTQVGYNNTLLITLNLLHFVIIGPLGIISQ